MSGAGDWWPIFPGYCDPMAVYQGNTEGQHRFVGQSFTAGIISLRSLPCPSPAGHMLVNPACYPGKIFIIMEGECKLVWLTDDAGTPPPVPLTLAQHSALHHHGMTAGQQTSAALAAAAAAVATAVLEMSPVPSAESCG